MVWSDDSGSLATGRPLANSLIVRDFFKVYRELRYANEGAIRLSEIEHNAYLNRLTLEVTHYDAYRSVNYKSNPDSTHWGYLTSFKGSSVTQNLPIKFVRQRVYEHINQSIWAYHQANETTEIQRLVVEQATNGILQTGLLGDATDYLVRVVLDATDWLGGEFDAAKAWLLGYEYSSSAPSGEFASAYTAYPIASPYPDVFKFKADIPVSFLFRLESWYLVNPAFYILANPTDTSDETEGEDEYPEPQQGDGDGGSQEFPESSPTDPLNDPRDGGAKPSPPIEPGTSYTWAGTLSGILLSAAQQGPLGYSDPISFTAQGNQFPFTAAGDRSEIINFAGESWSGGVTVRDRFGQEVYVYAENVGFRRGEHTVVVSIQI